MLNLSDSILSVGVDSDTRLFEGQFYTPNGISLNSYVILDDKIAVMDSVGEEGEKEWLENIEKAVGERAPDYLIVHHMEMDHSANIASFMKKYPEAKIVSSKMAFSMMKSMFATDFAERQIVASDGFELSLGKHSLHFIAAPNVHWPEVLMSYEPCEKVLFSADGFGKFGMIAKETAESDWTEEARRYYFGIVGKFGANVQAVLKKASALDIQTICALHGIVLRGEEAKKAISLYDTWSSYRAEKPNGTLIAFTSVYGHTKAAAEKLKALLLENGEKDVTLIDLTKDDMHNAVALAFASSRLVVATTTYNGGIFPTMRTFIESLADRNYQSRRVAFIENGSWAPVAIKTMKSMFEAMKDISICEAKSTIKIAPSEANIAELKAIAEEIVK